MDKNHYSQLKLKVELNDEDTKQVMDLLADIGPEHIPAALSLLRDPKMFNSLINTRTVLVKDASGERIEVRLTPTSLLEFLAA